jgi:hypothetical protein
MRIANWENLTNSEIIERIQSAITIIENINAERDAVVKGIMAAYTEYKARGEPAIYGFVLYGKHYGFYKEPTGDISLFCYGDTNQYDETLSW